MTDIKEEDNNSFNDNDFPETPIIPIDDGKEVDVPQIPSNQLLLLSKLSAGTL